MSGRVIYGSEELNDLLDARRRVDIGVAEVPQEFRPYFGQARRCQRGHIGIVWTVVAGVVSPTRCGITGARRGRTTRRATVARALCPRVTWLRVFELVDASPSRHVIAVFDARDAPVVAFDVCAPHGNAYGPATQNKLRQGVPGVSCPLSLTRWRCGRNRISPRLRLRPASNDCSPRVVTFPVLSNSHHFACDRSARGLPV